MPELIGRPSMTESCRVIHRRVRGILRRLARVGDTKRPVAPESTRATEVTGVDAVLMVTIEVIWA